MWRYVGSGGTDDSFSIFETPRKFWGSSLRGCWKSFYCAGFYFKHFALVERLGVRAEDPGVRISVRLLGSGGSRDRGLGSQEGSCLHGGLAGASLQVRSAASSPLCPCSCVSAGFCLPCQTPSGTCTPCPHGRAGLCLPSLLGSPLIWVPQQWIQESAQPGRCAISK